MDTKWARDASSLSRNPPTMPHGVVASIARYTIDPSPFRSDARLTHSASVSSGFISIGRTEGHRRVAQRLKASLLEEHGVLRRDWFESDHCELA